MWTNPENPEPSIAGERIPLRNINSPYYNGSLPIVEPTLDELRKLILLRSEWNKKGDNDH